MSASTERGILHTKIERLNKVVDLKEKERKEWADACIKKQSNIEALQEENRELREALQKVKDELPAKPRLPITTAIKEIVENILSKYSK